MHTDHIGTHWKAVVENIHDGIIIVDVNGRILSVNRAFEQMSGYRRQDVVGKPCTALNCNLCAIALEKNRAHWCMLFRLGKLQNQHCTLVRKDGTRIHSLKNATLLRNDDGTLVGAVETITDITALIEKDNQIAAFRRDLRSEDSSYGMIGTSPAMRHIFDLIANAAQSDAPLVIYGQSGTGKELAAQALHDLGPRRQGPFIKINCAALSESLLESELFGHVKGAFTGAYRHRKGRFESAQNGDIFLDEIGDLSPSTQVKLLRVLEEKVIERVGDNQPIPVDVRIISATNRDLRKLVAKGAFREDLYFRINVIPIELPPLNQRREDIPLLAQFFMRRASLKSGKSIRKISNRAMEALMSYPWPGNVRELKSAFEYAAVSCGGSEIRRKHLPPNIAQAKAAHIISDSVPLKHDSLKRTSLIRALQQARGNRTEAARLLGVSRVTIWNWIKRYGIKTP